MVSRSLVAVALLVFACPPVHADQYQDAIAKAFPGFHIMSRSEFHPEIQKKVKSNPALITGRFNNDDLDDFAAIIRNDVKKQSSSGKTLYDGKFVVCHGSRPQGYACQQTGTRVVYQDLELYLERVPPGFTCPMPNGKRIKVKTDGIGTQDYLGMGSVKMYIQGMYYDCSED